MAEKRAERVAAKRLPTKGTAPTTPSEATSTTIRLDDFSSGRSGSCPFTASSMVKSVAHTVWHSADIDQSVKGGGMTRLPIADSNEPACAEVKEGG